MTKAYPSRRILGLLIVVLLAITAAGCSTMRSISNSGYDRWGRGPSERDGELSEFNVLGIDPSRDITEQEIAAQFSAERQIRLKKNSSIVLIQSGAMFPDEPMQCALQQHFTVMPFSGKGGYSANYSKALRLAAAQGGCDKILVYWGILEAEQKDLATKGVSWVPIVGSAVPDEVQSMRIRLKMVIMDARTGQWTVLAPQPVGGRSLISAHANREKADQSQVAALKKAGYEALAKELTDRFTE